MNLVRVNPFWESRGFSSLADRFFNEGFTGLLEEGKNRRSNPSWAPAVDVTETPHALVFTVELPGLEKDQVEISVKDGRLTLSGERKYPEEPESKRYRVERRYGRFYRSLLLPDTVDEEKISANLKDGLLTVTLPKKEEVKPRQIPVH